MHNLGRIDRKKLEGMLAARIQASIPPVSGEIKDQDVPS
jgi:hypothetical protein